MDFHDTKNEPVAAFRFVGALIGFDEAPRQSFEHFRRPVMNQD